MIAELLLTLGLHFAVPAELESSQGYEIEAGMPWLYAWGSYDEPGFKPLGQPFGDVELIGFGIGTRLQINNKLSFTVEYGKAKVSVDPKPAVRNEVIVAQLQHDHGEPPFSPDQFSYRLQNDYMIRLGAVWKLTDHFELHADYRWLRVQEEMDMWTGTRHIIGVTPDCGCWWQERNTINLSGVEVGISFSF